MGITRSNIARQLMAKGGQMSSPRAAGAESIGIDPMTGASTFSGGDSGQNNIRPEPIRPIEPIRTIQSIAESPVVKGAQKAMFARSLLSGNPFAIGLGGLELLGNIRTAGGIGPYYEQQKTAITNFLNQPRTYTPPVVSMGGDSEPIRPVMAATAPTDVEKKLSDFDLYMQALRATKPIAFTLDPRFRAAKGGSIDAGAESIKYEGDVKPRLVSAPNPMADLNDQYQDAKEQNIIPKTMTFEQFKELMSEYYADGGEVRQNYGLGSIVKKITKPIKKLFKSDVGKAALTAAAIYGGGKFLGGPTGASFKRFIFGSPASYLDKFAVAEKPGLLGKLGLTKGGGEMALTKKGLAGLGILGTSALAGLTADEEDETDLEGITSREDTSGITELLARYPEIRFRVPEAYRLADGGMPLDSSKDILDLIRKNLDGPTPESLRQLKEVFPEAVDEILLPGGKGEMFRLNNDFLKEFLEGKQETFRYRKEPYGPSFDREEDRMQAEQGGLMNLDGLEMDLRGGGFVPIGKAEKADDVPARLSKNEFVFTADAVRAAGGGSVDEGAKKMYKTMKELESRVG